MGIPCTYLYPMYLFIHIYPLNLDVPVVSRFLSHVREKVYRGWGFPEVDRMSHQVLKRLWALGGVQQCRFSQRKGESCQIQTKQFASKAF